MLVTPAYAQAAPGGGVDMITSFLPIILLIVIFWFFIFRPQQKRAKEHQTMLSNIRRGDTIVTSGGIVGKVTKAADDQDLEVEISQGVKTKVVRAMVADVRSKPEPVNDNATKAPAKKSKSTARKTTKTDKQGGESATDSDDTAESGSDTAESGDDTSKS